MNAVKFLLKEHQKVKKMLSAITKKSLGYQTKKNKFKTLSKDLTHHEKMEQKIWYPFLKKNTNLSNVIKHLVSEEKTAAKEIKKISKIKQEDKLNDKLANLKKDVLHHAKEEETKLFPKVKKSLNETELKEIGTKMKKYKNKLDKTKK